MFLVCVIVAVLVAFVDLAFKQQIEAKLQKGQSHTMLNGRIVIRKVHNKGMMLNAMQEHPRGVKTLSLVSLVLILIYQIFLLRKPEHGIEKIAMALITGGAVSNTYDRMKRGYVVDYVGFPSRWKKLSNITYNIGDFSIFAGAFLAIAGSVFKEL